MRRARLANRFHIQRGQLAYLCLLRCFDDMLNMAVVHCNTASDTQTQCGDEYSGYVVKVCHNLLFFV